MDGPPFEQDVMVQPLLTDLYQLNMCYAYWKSGTHNHPACFDLFFRKNPFNGEFTVFAGLEDCVRFVKNYRFSASDIEFLEGIIPHAEPAFFDYLRKLDCTHLKLYAIDEGTVVFPRVPLVTVEGPLALCQLMETTLLTLVNYASLVATNAARMRNVAGNHIKLFECGLRRAQGPNGGLTASKYSYIGGFDASSNVLAGKLFGIPLGGSQSDSFVCSFSDDCNLKCRCLRTKDGRTVDFLELCKEKRDLVMEQINWKVDKTSLPNSEFLAFVADAISNPNSFVALVDTYDTLRCGVVNFCAVAQALHECGFAPIGCRIDSGDLSYVSKEVRARFDQLAAANPAQFDWMRSLKIVASNGVNEDTLTSLNDQGHAINVVGVGSHLVTCQKQPALGCVYKLVTKCDQPKMKLSQDMAKLTIPGRKRAFRLFSRAGHAILDLLQLADEPAPQPEQPILCRHPFLESKRAIVKPTRVEELQHRYWSDGQLRRELPPLAELRRRVARNMTVLREGYQRILMPIPYKVSVSETLYTFLHSLWLDHAPIGQLE